MEEKLTDQERARRDKLAKYKELGIDPFGHKFIVTDNVKSVHEKCDELTNEQFAISWNDSLNEISVRF